jgi:ribonucleoside-diphosphate reductase alpha chain
MTLVLSENIHSPSFNNYAERILTLRYAHVYKDRIESWRDITERVCKNVLGCSEYRTGKSLPGDIYDAIYEAILTRKFIPGGRILSQAGRPYHQTDNCYCLRAEDTREGWADLIHKCTLMFMSGGGIGVDYSNIRHYGSPLGRSGGIASGPLALIKLQNAVAEAARQGGERRGAGYASLPWDHPDILSFIKMKQDKVSLSHTNISTRFDQNWLYSFHSSTERTTYTKANDSFYNTLKSACQYGEPGFQFDDDRQVLRNACTEIISDTSGDSCCLGSVNIANIDSPDEMDFISELGVIFLLCNTIYTDVPLPLVRDVKNKYRRLGLGIMGLAEWFIQRGLPYGYCEGELPLWLQAYVRGSEGSAKQWSSYLSMNEPVAKRAIAPTGTISIAGGRTTPGIEPVFHTAYKRTYNTLKTQEHGEGYVTEYVVEPIVQKWIDEGYDVRDIDTAYTLSQSIEGIERRIKFQAFMQRYVDNAISSTVNLPTYEEGIEDKIAPVLIKYLPYLRGITFYPDGARDNQPVVPVDLPEALSMLGKGNASLEEGFNCRSGECGL